MEKLQGLGMTSLRTRQRLVERLTEQGIKDIRILEVMRDTPRHIFLDEAFVIITCPILKNIFSP